METIVKRVRDCTCKELSCPDCPFAYSVRQEVSGLKYDNNLFTLCVNFPMNMTIGEAYQMYLKKGKLNGEMVKRCQRKLTKQTIIKGDNYE